MPSTRGERIVAGLGLVVLVVLAALVAVEWLDYRDTVRSAGAASSTPPATQVDAVRRTTAKPRVVPVARRAAPNRRRAFASAGVTRFVLAATHGDCWLTVRAGSASGATLFAGLLPHGHSRKFRKKRLWIRAGAASNLDIWVNGRPVKNHAQGTVDVVVDARTREFAA